MSDITMDWIWSRYTTSPDPAAGMQSLYQTCSAITKHVLLPSHIVLSGGGFTLLPELAQILLDAVPSLGQVLDRAMRLSGLPGAQSFCQTELRTLTCTTGLDVATQSQVVRSWVNLVDKAYIAMTDIKYLACGRPIHVLGRERPSQIRQIVTSLPPSLRIKLPADFLRSHGILVLPPAANAREVERQRIRYMDYHARMCTGVSDGAPQQERGNKCDRSYSRSPADHIETRGLASSQSPRRAAHDRAVVTPDNIRQDMYEQQTMHTPRFLSSTPKVASAHSPASVSGLSTSMDDLVTMYHCASTSGWSLSSRIARIASKSVLNSSDIDHRRSDSNAPYFGQVRLNQPFFLSTENVVREMQQILTVAFSFTESRPVCFLVDPHGVLMGMLRGSSCVDELQVAWTGLRERLEIAQRRFGEYCADCVAERTPLAELDEACAGIPPVSTSVSTPLEDRRALDASTQASSFAVTQQAPTPGRTSSHSVVYDVDGSACSTAADETSSLASCAVGAGARSPPVLAIATRVASAIPATDALKSQQVVTVLRRAPVAATPAAVKDPPRVWTSPPVSPIHELAVTMEDESRECGGLDNLQGRADHVRKDLGSMRNDLRASSDGRSGIPPHETRVSDPVKCFEVAQSSSTSCHDSATPGQSSTTTSDFLSSSSTANSELQDLVLAPTRNIRTEDELGGQVGLQSSKKSIGAEDYSVLLQSPVPVIAVGAVELGGRENAPASRQQGSISNAETRTSPALDDASSYGAPDLACTTPASVSVSSPCSGNTRTEGSRPPGERDASAEIAAPAVVRQAPTPQAASPLAVRDVTDADIRTSHAFEAVALRSPLARFCAPVVEARRLNVSSYASRGPPVLAQSKSSTASIATVYPICLPLPSSASAASASTGLPFAGTSTTVAGRSSASDIQPQKLALNLSCVSAEPEVEFGGQREGQTILVSIGSREYSVLLPSPAPVLAAGVHTVELGGRENAPASSQQGSISKVEIRTSPALDVANSYGAPDLACTTPASVSVSSPCSGNTRAEGSRRPGERDASAEIAASAVVRQTPTPRTASTIAAEMPAVPAADRAMSWQAQVIRRHAPAAAVFATVKHPPYAVPPTSTLPSTCEPSVTAGEGAEFVGLDGRLEQRNIFAVSDDLESSIGDMEPLVAPMNALATVEYVPEAAMPAEVKDPPSTSSSAPSCLSRELFTAAEVEGTGRGGLGGDFQERAEYAACSQGNKLLTSRNPPAHLLDNSEASLEERAKELLSPTPASSRRGGILGDGLHVPDLANGFEAMASSAFVTSRSSRPPGASVPLFGSVSTTVAIRPDASDEVQELALPLSRSIETEDELGGQLGQRRSKNSIVSGKHSVLLQSPAPVIAVGVCAVELGGQKSIVSTADQRNSNAEGEGHTLRPLEKMNSCEVKAPPHFCPDAVRSLELTGPTYAHLDAAFVPAPRLVTFVATVYLDFVPVSTILRTRKVRYLENREVDDAAPGLVWAREGIGTSAWN